MSERRTDRSDDPVSVVDSRFDYMLSLVSLTTGLSKEDIAEQNSSAEKANFANEFFKAVKSRSLVFLESNSFQQANKRFGRNAVFLYTGEQIYLRSQCAFFIKEISVENLPQNVMNMSVIFLVLNASSQHIFGTLHQILKHVYLQRLKKTWCEDAELSTLPAAYENLLYDLESLSDAFKIAHLGLTRGMELRGLPKELLNMKDEEEFLPDGNAMEMAEDIVLVWKQQVEQMSSSDEILPWAVYNAVPFDVEVQSEEDVRAGVRTSTNQS